MKIMTQAEFVSELMRISDNGFTEECVNLFFETMQFSRRGELHWENFGVRWVWEHDEWSGRMLIEFFGSN